MFYKKVLEKAQVVYFLAIGTLMHYFLEEVINVGLYISYRHAFALLIFGSAFVCFLIKPNFPRAVVAVKSALVYGSPLLLGLTISFFIWLVNGESQAAIFRCLSNSLIYTNMFSCALCAAAFLYVFGEKGIWYNLICIIIANAIFNVMIILQYGIGSYISEFITLIVSFANVTGDIIVQAEIHELAFCTGAYMIYMLLIPRKKLMYFVFFAATGFLFLTAFKRIAVISFVPALGICWIAMLISKFSKKITHDIMIVTCVVMILIFLGYIAILKMNLFEVFEEIGIETNGRDRMYGVVDNLYEFSPEFLGRGLGYLAYRVNTGVSLGHAAVHNGYLQYYIDLGFWGYIMWLAAMTILQIEYFSRAGKIQNGVVALALLIYLLIISATDNTFSYPLLNTTIGIIMMGHGFDDRVLVQEKKLFGEVYDNVAYDGKLL